MVRVPQYEGPQVRPTPLRAEQSIRAPAGAFGADVGQALQQTGQQVGQTVNLLDRRMVEQAKEDADTEAFRAYTAAGVQTQKLFYEGDNAIYNRRGGQAIGASNEAAVELKRIGEESGAALKSPYAKQQFERLWARQQDSEMGAVSRHERDQRKEFKDQTVVGLVAMSQNLATLRYNDAKEVEEQIGIAEIGIRANTKGLPPEAVTAQVANMRSGIQKSVVLRMATDNPLAANKYYQEHAAEFTAEDNVTLQRTLSAPVKRAEARIEGDKVIKEVTETKAAEPATVKTAMASVESGNRQVDKDGKLVTSSAGNFGVMQINDTSGAEAAAALGIAYDPKKAREDKAYNQQLGEKYYDIQFEKYGNRTLALAAYNAGGGNVDAWIKQFGDPRTGQLTDAAWAAKLPFAETRQYITRVEGKIRGGVQDNIDLTRAEQIVQERFPDDPEKADAVTAHIQRQNALREQALRDRQQEAWKRGLQHIDNGGSVDNLPPDVLENMAPGRVKDLEAREASRIRGIDKAENPKELDRLMALSVTDPDKFLAEDPTKWDLPRAQVTSLIGRKAALMTKEAKEEAKVNDVRKAISLTSNLLRAAQIDPTPKDTDKSGAEKMNAYTARLMERLDEFKEKEGRRATDAEVVAMGQDLLLPGRLSVDWWPDSKTFAFQVKPEQRKQFYVEFEHIPANEKADIVKALGARATNDLVEQVYAATRRKDLPEVQRLLKAPAATVAPPGPGATTVPVN